jgi:prevent-host-death family protein
MKTIELSTADRSLAEYADELGDEPVVLTRHNKPVAALVSLKDIDSESLALSTNVEFLAIIEQARREIAKGHTFTLEEVREQVLP